VQSSTPTDAFCDVELQFLPRARSENVARAPRNTALTYLHARGSANLHRLHTNKVTNNGATPSRSPSSCHPIMTLPASPIREMKVVARSGYKSRSTTRSDKLIKRSPTRHNATGLTQRELDSMLVEQTSPGELHSRCIHMQHRMPSVVFSTPKHSAMPRRKMKGSA